MFRYLLTCLLLWGYSSLPLSAQESTWELDRIEGIRRAKQEREDSLMRHYAGKWEIGVSYGLWTFGPGQKSTADEPFFMPPNMGIWQIQGRWHFTERFYTGLTLGIQIHKDEPQPDIAAILGGDDVLLEGSAGAFLPLELEIGYQLKQGRFRPMVEAGIGMVRASAKQIVAEGTLNSGINRTETSTEGRTAFAKAGIGFAYRLGLHTQFQLRASYYGAGLFDTPIGGYRAYGGLNLTAGFSLVL